MPSELLPAPLTPLVRPLDELTDVDDALRAWLLADTIVSTLADRVRDYRVRLDDLALHDAGDGGMTRRVRDAGQVVVTDPKPKPTVVDPAAFALWVEDTNAAADEGEELPVRPEASERVDVRDTGALAAIVRDAAMLDPADPADDGAALDLLRRLPDAVRVEVELLLPADALDTLVKAGRCAVLDAGVFDKITGERVPGVDVKPAAAPKVQVRKDADAREVVAAQVRGMLTAASAEGEGADRE